MSEQEPVGWIQDWNFEHLVGGAGDRHPIMFWPMPQDKTGLVPLFAKPEPYGPQWTKEPPIVPGHYWVWQPENCWPCAGFSLFARVSSAQGNLRAITDRMVYAEDLDQDNASSVWQFALWLGPIAAPAPPTKEQYEQAK